MSTSESQFDNFEDAAVEEFAQDTNSKVINVTNVNPHLPGLDPTKVQLPYWLLWLLVGMASLAIGEFIGLLII